MSERPGARRLIVMAKAAVIGGAKSRLAADAGPAAAWRIYRAIMAKVLRQVVDPRWRTLIAAAPDAAAARAFPGVWPAGLPRRGQGEGALGARIARAFSQCGPTIVIGSDAPDVCAADIWAGFRALARRRLVLGPAGDGGYWLIGAREPLGAHALAGVRWSSPQALADTVQALAWLGPPALLRTLHDVDTLADWRARGGRA